MNPQQPPVAGMPEGTELVRIGVAGDDDFELVGPLILKGKRAGAASGVIVRPAKDYTFQPAKFFDMKTFQLVDGPKDSYMPVMQEVSKEITVTLKVSITNSFDEKVLSDTLAALKGLPGFVSLERA